MVQLSTPWIFLRGLTRGNVHWGDFPKLFQKQNPDIEFELLEIPGNGSSSNGLTPLDPQILINQIRLKSKILQKSQMVNICGISFGGMIAIKWAELYPNEVKTVVAINSSFSQFSNFYDRLNPVNYLNFLRATITVNLKLREKLILDMTSNNHARTHSFIEEFAAFSVSHPFRFLNLIRQLILAKNIKVNLPLLTPVKIVCSKKDRLVKVNCSISLGKYFCTDLIVHPNAGHDIPLDDPEWLVHQIT